MFTKIKKSPLVSRFLFLSVFGLSFGYWSFCRLLNLMLHLLELLLVSQRTEGEKIRGSMNHRLTGMITRKAVAIPSSTVYASVLIVAVVYIFLVV